MHSTRLKGSSHFSKVACTLNTCDTPPFPPLLNLHAADANAGGAVCSTTNAEFICNRTLSKIRYCGLCT